MIGKCKICKQAFEFKIARSKKFRTLCSAECRRRNHAANALESHNRKVIRRLYGDS